MLLIFQRFFIEQSCSMADDHDFNKIITNAVNNSITSKKYLANTGILPFFHHPSGERETPQTTSRFPKISDEPFGGHWFVSSYICSYLLQIPFGARQPDQRDSFHIPLGAGEKAPRALFLSPVRIR